MSTQAQGTVADTVASLTAAGGAFELAVEEVRGAPVNGFAHRARSLGDVLSASTEFGDRTYIATATERISFAEHADRVAAVAATLREDYQVGRGDRVAVFAANTPDWIVAFWATVSLGAIAVGYNAWWSAREVSYALDHTSPSVLFADEKRAAVLAGAEGADVPVVELHRDVPAMALRHAGRPLPQCPAADDDPAVILYTSGTSGRPKGVVHSHRNLTSVIEYHRLNGALAQALGDPCPPADKGYLLAMPLFHIASLHNLAVPRLADGSTVVLHEGRFDVDRVLRLVESRRVTNWGAVPTMASRLVEHGDLSRYDLSSLTAFSLASAPSSPELKRRLRAAFPAAERSLVDSYGLTESATGISVATHDDLEADPGTLGSPITAVELEIRDESDRAVPDGTHGEVCIRSPYVMLGYWQDPDATAETIRSGGWLHTGDIGTLENGKLRLTSRRSDLILRGGENVYPAEIENALAEHPAVQECLVLGTPHPDLGQEVAAVVVLDGSAATDEQELAAFVRERVAYFKVPSRWRLTRDELPRNATGKVIRGRVTVY